MKLTNRQALILLEIAKDSLKINDSQDNIFTWDINIRERLINIIINQQGDEIVDLSKENSTVHIPRLSEE